MSRRMEKTGAAVVVAGTVLGIGGAIYASNGPESDPSNIDGIGLEAGATPGQTQEALRQFLDVTNNRYDCDDPNKYSKKLQFDGRTFTELEVGALQPGRVSTDSLSTPLTRENPDETFNNLGAKMCGDPLLAESYKTALGRMTFNGVRLADAIPELKSAKAPLSTINDRALKTIPMVTEGKNYSAVEIKAMADKREVHEDGAEVVMTILDRLSQTDYVYGKTPTISYALKNGGASNSVLPEVGLGMTYKGDFMPFTITAKGIGCIARLGVNLDDARPAILGCDEKTPTDKNPDPSKPNQPPTQVPGCPEGYRDEDKGPGLRCLHPRRASAPKVAQTGPQKDTAEPTPGGTRGRAETVVGEQGGNPGNLNPAPYGTEVPGSQSGGSAPGGGNSSVVGGENTGSNSGYQSGTESGGTSAGTGNVDQGTNVGNDTSGGDAGGF